MPSPSPEVTLFLPRETARHALAALEDLQDADTWSDLESEPMDALLSLQEILQDALEGDDGEAA